MKNILVLIIVVLILSCKNMINQQKPSFKSNNNQELTFIFDSINILNFERKIAKSSFKDTTVCKKWNLSDKDIIKLMKISKKIDAQEWHYAYDVFPCGLIGEFKYRDRNFKFDINSGGWFDIITNDTIQRYGCKSIKCKDFMLSLD